MSYKKFDENGFFQIDKNPISKAGVFDYLGSSIAPTQAMRDELGIDANKMYKVFRNHDELEKAIDSLKLKPIIDDHTLLGLEIGGVPAEKKGVHGTLGEQFSLVDDILYSNLVVHSETLKELIENGKKELSCGFLCDYVKQNGVYNGESYDFIQTNLRGNHIALVDEGRMGKDVAILDSKDNLNGDILMDREELKKLILECMGKPDAMDECKTSATDADETKPADATTATDAEPTATETKTATDESEIEIKKEIEPTDSEGIKSMIKEILLELTPKAEDVEEKIEKAIAQDRKDQKLNQEIYSKSSKIVGSFASDSLKDTVSYVTKKLGLKNDINTLQAYLLGAETSKVSTSRGFDSKQNVSSNIDSYINS